MFCGSIVLCLLNCIIVIVEVIEGRVRPTVRMLVNPALDTRGNFLGGVIFPHSARNYEGLSKVTARNLTSKLLPANSRLSPDG